LSELTESFDKNLVLLKDSNDEKKKPEDATKAIPNFFDFIEGPKHKNSVFRLIGRDSMDRNFQETDFQQKCSKHRQSLTLHQRRTKRKDYFENVKKEILDKNKCHILQHEDDGNLFVLNKNEKKNEKKQRAEFRLNVFKNKLLEKQKASKSTKIASKKQMKQHQHDLMKRNKSKSSFCDDWNNNNLISLMDPTKNGNKINIKNFVDEYECFDGYKPKHLRFKRGIDIISEMEQEPIYINMEYDESLQKYVEVKNIKNSKQKMDEYDYYELDEEADPDQVIQAIQEQQRLKSMKKEKKDTKEEQIRNDDHHNEDALDLEWKLEKIKNKHLAKHFDANYEGPSFGFKYNSKESETARYIEMERSDFYKDDIGSFMDSNQTQKYYEDIINEEEELEKEDEGYIDNDYPDEHELSDDEYFVENDYYPQFDDDQYHDIDQSDNYQQNALGLDFFTGYEFN